MSGWKLFLIILEIPKFTNKVINRLRINAYREKSAVVLDVGLGAVLAALQGAPCTKVSCSCLGLTAQTALFAVIVVDGNESGIQLSLTTASTAVRQ